RAGCRAAGQPGPGLAVSAAPRAAKAHRARARACRPRRGRIRLQPRAWHPAGDTGRERPGAGRAGARAHAVSLSGGRAAPVRTVARKRPLHSFAEMRTYGVLALIGAAGIGLAHAASAPPGAVKQVPNPAPPAPSRPAPARTANVAPGRTTTTNPSSNQPLGAGVA